MAEGLQYYQAFRVFKEIKKLEELEGPGVFKESRILKEFRKFEEFKESLTILFPIFYYKDFQLLLCLFCSSAINLSSLSSTKKYLV